MHSCRGSNSFEDLALRSFWLVAPISLESICGSVPVHFRKPFLNVGDDWLQNHCIANLSHAYTIALEPHLLRQANGLTITVAKQLGDFRHKGCLQGEYIP